MAPPRARFAFLGLAIGIMAQQEYGRIEFPEPTIMPRYYLGAPQPALYKRANKCQEGQHQCVDVGFADTCCGNDKYCYVDHASATVSCCPLELNCDSTCGSTAYYCPQTTSTVSAGSTITSTVPFCCPRACPSKSFYRCEASLGGQCCPYDHDCANSICLSTKTTPASPRVTALDEGCTTSQTKCDDGKGCCNVWMECTSVSGEAVCAPGPSISTVPNGDGGGASLSDGAKAGIGAGVVIGVSAVTAGLTWLWLSKRRRARAAATSQASGDDDLMEEVGSPDPRATGLARDYSGPDAVAGPFTEHGPHETPTPGRGVPAQPHAPGDIAAPVEIDSRNVVSPIPAELESPMPMSPYSLPSPTPLTTENRAELYGSEVPIAEVPANEEVVSPPVSPEPGAAPKVPKTP